jgi:C4-dicarboxylate transporter, DctM subunit
MDISPLILGISALVILVILIILGVHVGLALGLVGFLGLVIKLGDFGRAMPLLLTTPYSTVVSFTFIIIPLFVLMGSLAFYAGFGESLYDWATKWLGKVPGSIAIATAWACLLFGTVSGSNVSAAAIFTKISLPEMIKRGYNPKFSVGAIVCSSMLTIIMPPSLILVIYGMMTNEPIGKLLIAGIMPSIIFAVAITVFIWGWLKIKPSNAPNFVALSYPWKERFISLKNVWMVVLLAAIVLGGIYSGVFSPTEAAAAGTFALFIFAWATRKLNLDRTKKAFIETVEFSVMLFLILIGAYIFTRFLAMSGFTTQMLNALVNSNIPGIAIIIGLVVIMLILGLFIDAISIMAILLPISYPVVLQLGYDGVWYGIVVLLATTIGAMTPPFGLAVFAVKAASNIDMSVEEMFAGCTPYTLMSIVFTLILIAVPSISLFLPNLMMSGPR